MEKRRHNRVDVHWKSRMFKKGNGVVSGLVENVSIGGVFVRGATRFNPADSVLIEIEISDETPVRRIVAQCEVMRIAPEGFGLRFTKIADDDLGYLFELVARRWSSAG